MTALNARLTSIGGPTVLLAWEGLRLLTDPTLDPAGTGYTLPTYTLRTRLDPAVSSEAVGLLDAVLRSHDHHCDHLDHSGRELRNRVGCVCTTAAGATRLGGGVVGLLSWQSIERTSPGGRVLRITGTPARHGPAHADRGPVIGFVLTFTDDPAAGIYLSGATVWYEGVQAVSSCFSIRMAVLFMGAARVAAVGDWPLTFTASEGVEAARAFSEAIIVPVHYEGWEHCSESRLEITQAFAAAGLNDRLYWLPAGTPTQVAGT
jgi:L-ascorbate metabolism protein UlaG (beta-lactamase superfamily)